MKANRNFKPLEKFKKSKLAERLPRNIERILAQVINEENLTIDEIFSLSEEERKKTEAILTCGYLTLAGDDREQFLSNTDGIITKM